MVVRDPEDPGSPGSRPVPALLLMTFLSLIQVPQRPGTVVRAPGEANLPIPELHNPTPASTTGASPQGQGQSPGRSAAPPPSRSPIPVSPRCEHSGLSVGQGVVGEGG